MSLFCNPLFSMQGTSKRQISVFVNVAVFSSFIVLQTTYILKMYLHFFLSIYLMLSIFQQYQIMYVMSLRSAEAGVTKNKKITNAHAQEWKPRLS